MLGFRHSLNKLWILGSSMATGILGQDDMLHGRAESPLFELGTSSNISWRNIYFAK